MFMLSVCFMLFLGPLGFLLKCVQGVPQNYPQNVSQAGQSRSLDFSPLTKKAILFQSQKVASPPTLLFKSKFCFIPLFPTQKTAHQQVLLPLSLKHPESILSSALSPWPSYHHFYPVMTPKLLFLPPFLPPSGHT